MADIETGEIAPDIENHPWPPFVPDGARTLIMGTFPPGKHRWSMDFYYPNATNDFWRVMGLLFLGNPLALYDARNKTYDLPRIKQLMTEHRIALHDSCAAVRRLKGNASDKFLEVVRPVDLKALVERMPGLVNIATTGEKAATVIASITGTEPPKMGEFVEMPANTLCDHQPIKIWRMPSTSRAYPMKVEAKAEYYKRLLMD